MNKCPCCGMLRCVQASDYPRTTEHYVGRYGPGGHPLAPDSPPDDNQDSIEAFRRYLWDGACGHCEGTGKDYIETGDDQNVTNCHVCNGTGSVCGACLKAIAACKCGTNLDRGAPPPATRRDNRRPSGDGVSVHLESLHPLSLHPRSNSTEEK